MNTESEQFWQTIDNYLLDAIQLIRARWSNFNNIPAVYNLVTTIYDAYRISGKASDLEDRGHIK